MMGSKSRENAELFRDCVMRLKVSEGRSSNFHEIRLNLFTGSESHIQR